MAVSLAGFAIVACNDLDTEPLGSTVTSEQKEQVYQQDPEMAQAAVQSLAQAVKATNSCGQSSVRHHDFGVPSIFLITDQRGMDMHSENNGYNWFTAALSLQDFGGRYFDNIQYWNCYYDQIKACNLTAEMFPANAEGATNKYSRAQAIAFRAYAYEALAQMYQFTYIKNPDAPCVPILTELNANEAAVNGNPRASVKAVYEQAISDLTEAIALLDEAKEGGVTRANKTFVDQAVCYGLRARAYLIMNEWEKCASDASKALELAKANGLAPLSIQEASVPGFTSLSYNNWMWGVQYLSTEPMTQGVLNFASMMGNWMSNGYSSAGVYRAINTKLFNQIPGSDVRKGWWLNNLSVPASLPADYKEFIEIANSGSTQISPFSPYTQLKFGASGGEVFPGGSFNTSGATDVPLMRIEELYYMLAEAQGHISLGEGVTTLQNFVKTYRNSVYTFTASSIDAFVDEIWFQRRIELWGEGFSYFDMMRLQKPLDRRGGGFPAEWVFNIAPENPCLIYEIVQSEVQANPLIPESEASNGGEIPTPVADE